MDGYSKIKPPSKIKSRSIDYSDLSSFPHSLKPKPNDLNPKSQESNQNNRRWTAHRCFPEEEEDENGGEVGFGAALSRNSYVSSSTSGFHSAVKRALSMRRSSSVAERYCRIHDQFLTVPASPIDDDEEVEGEEHSKEGSETMRSVKKKKKEKEKQHRAGKILKACKRLFGL